MSQAEIRLTSHKEKKHSFEKAYYIAQNHFSCNTRSGVYRLTGLTPESALICSV